MKCRSDLLKKGSDDDLPLLRGESAEPDSQPVKIDKESTYPRSKKLDQNIVLGSLLVILDTTES